MSMMDEFSDPSLFDSLGFGDKMMGSLITMIMGMGITFCVLLILWGFVAIMGRCVSGMNKDKKAQETPIADATPSQAAAPVVSDDADITVAVIAAALEAYRADGGTGSLIVRKITRLSGESTPWSNAAIDDCIESRRF